MSQDGGGPLNKKGGVEKLKDKLYSRMGRGAMQDVRAPLTPDQAEAPRAWDDSKPSIPTPEEGRMMRQEAPKRRSFAKIFFFFSLVFFVVAAGAAAYFFFDGAGFISPNNIDIQIVAPSLVNGGETAQFQYIITNHNSTPLQLADLVIEYPDGARDPTDPTQPLTSERQSIGTIAAGAQVKETSSAILYGQEGSTTQVRATLDYSVQGSNAVFTKEEDTSITIGSSPVSVSVSMPQSAVSGEPFDVTLTVRSNATSPVDNVVVGAQYPFGFTAQSSSPTGLAGNTFWQLGTMAPGSTQTITIHGSIQGEDGDNRVFRFLAGQDSDPTDTSVSQPFLSTPATLTVEQPFVTGSIVLNGASGSTVSAPAGSTIAGEIDWQNNLSVAVSNLQVSLQLSGPTLDTSSVQAGTGFYQSSDNTITWTSDNDPTLATVAPGATGKLTFSFATLTPGTGGSVYGNPTVNLSLNVQGVRADQTGTAQSVSAVAQTQVNLASAVSLAASALHFSGAYINTGPMPPVAESQTTYTVQWSVKNSSNIVANASVSTVLPSYVDFVVGQSGITYDAGSRTVTWAMGDLKAGVGYTSSPLTESFQVQLNPSASQVGFAPQLTDVSQLSGTDRFAQTQVSATADALTTDLTSDPQFQSGMDTVQAKQ